MVEIVDLIFATFFLFDLLQILEIWKYLILVGEGSLKGQKEVIKMISNQPPFKSFAEALHKVH